MMSKNASHNRCRGKRTWGYSALCLCVFIVFVLAHLDASSLSNNFQGWNGSETLPPKDTINYIIIRHTDKLYKNYENPRAEILVGNVKVHHNGADLFCDSAVYFRETNTCYAFANPGKTVRMIQGDTISLLCRDLRYEGEEMVAYAKGKVELRHRNTLLTTDTLNYYRANYIDRTYDSGEFCNGGTLYDNGDTLVADRGFYVPSTHEAEFTDYNNNVQLFSKDFNLISEKLFYNTQTRRGKIVTPTNINSYDGTFVYGNRGEYDGATGNALLTDRSYIINGEYRVDGDSLYYNNEDSICEGFGNVILVDTISKYKLEGNYCRYERGRGYAMATDRAVAKEFSDGDTLYVHADILEMKTEYSEQGDTLRNFFAYHKVRAYRSDVQAVCDSMVTIMKDSCTYMYGQPILWSERQQLFGEEIRIYNNDSTIDWIHVIRQAMTIEQLDSASYNQVAGNEMFSYFSGGELVRNEAHGNVLVAYYMEEKDSTRIGFNYTETSKLVVNMKDRKMSRIWMPKAQGEMYPIGMIPPEKKTLPGFAWFDSIRPKTPDDIFEWKDKPADKMLVKQREHQVPVQQLRRKARQKESKADGLEY